MGNNNQQEDKKIIEMHYFKSLHNEYKNILDYDSNNTSRIKTIMDSTSNMMKHYCKYLTYNQLRAVHHEIKSTGANSLVNLMPKMAYMQARQDKKEARDLLEFIRELMELSIDSNEIMRKNFINYMDAIVAYHKFHGK